MNYNYPQEVAAQIDLITSNIKFNTAGQLIDVSENSIELRVAIRAYDVRIVEPLPAADYNELLLLNWIYCKYYQNRGVTPESDRVDQRHFPFKHMSKEGADAYWRSRFWRFESVTGKFEGSVLTRGYETRIVSPELYAEDELVFETHQENHVEVLEEAHYLSVMFPKFDIGDSQKFAFGQYPLDDDGQGGIIRFYLHLNIQCLSIAIPFILSKITVCFNDRLIPFQLKFLSKAENFARADHFVLYVERRHFFVAGLLIRNIYDDISTFIDASSLPLFVRKVLPGIGFAKSPYNEQLSFGANRARTIAKSILKKLEYPKDPNVLAASVYLGNTWGGLGNFNLNPHPTFAIGFKVFNKTNTPFFQDVDEAETLSAAWYIARLLCREAIWVEEGQCNWMSYQKMTNGRLGYRFLNVDEGLTGLEGVLVFLRAFQDVGIRDAVIEHVLQAGIKFFSANKGALTIKTSVGFALRAIVRSTIVKISPKVFSSKVLKTEIEKVIYQQNPSSISESDILNRIMKNHIQVERPIGNRLDGSDNFCADLQFGLAGYGYAYLRLYDAKRVDSLV
ncbi:T3SS effector HopA1 family protein [Dyadobacter sp. 3J3]|uniref:T3SS effector HopA1 family protein n=1 Tax=Dyadobacter sp. 3J3 TaxID=2606600 RepID=UPI00135B380C|nr:T3SS effector HopA1 family protein [Dyadobacter sp. 3J3]